MQIRIGIVGRCDGWKQLLTQEGVPWSIVTDSFFSLDFSVVVASDDVNDREAEMLRRYLILGGSVLCSAKVYERIRQSTSQLVHIDYLFPGPESIFGSLGIIDVRASCQLAWNANELLTSRKILAAHVGRYGHGHIIALPFNPADLVCDRRFAVKSFYSPERRLPFEAVSLVSKGEVRLLVSRCLEILHHRRDLPYVHLWYYPDGARSLFAFRIDTDSGTEDQVNNLYLLLHRNRRSATWFVNAKGQEKFLRLFREMDDQEIGLHCFEHRTFPDYERNIENIDKAKTALQNAGLEPKGFAAPFGRWNAELGRAIAESGFAYSSEFAYDYDNIPSIPLLPQGKGALQVPIHPICIGSLKRHGYSDRQMIKYFSAVVQRKLSMREPIIFYHHPADGHDEVVEWLFHETQRECIPSITMQSYARWWNARTSFIPTIDCSEKELRISGGKFDKSIRLRITKADGAEAIVPPSKHIDLAGLRWNSKPPDWTMPQDYLRARRFNYRVPLIRGIDAVTKLLSKKASGGK
jgi:hypothetical protein